MSKMLKHVVLYASSQYVAQGLGFFTALLMRRFLGPLSMGIWATIQLIMSYVSYVHVANSAVYYKVPILNGQGKTEEALRIQRVVFTFFSVTLAIAGSAMLAYAFIFRAHLEPPLFWGLVCGSAILIFQRLCAYQILLLRANKNFELLSNVVVLEAAMNLVLVIFVVNRYKIYGLYAVSLILPVILFLFIIKKRTAPLALEWDTKKFIECVRFGAPVFIRDYLGQILNSVDRLLIVSFLGFEALGIFSVATMARNYSEGVYKNFGAVISPYLLEELGRSADLKKTAHYVRQPTRILSCFMALFLGGIFIFCGPFIAWVLPNFSEGIQTVKIYLITTYFATLSTQALIFLTAINKQSKLIALSLTSILLNACLGLVFINQGWGIQGVALGTAIASAFVFLFLFGYAMLQVGSPAEAARDLLKTLCPFFLGAPLLFFLERISLAANPLGDLLAKTGIFYVCLAPFVYQLNRDTHIIGKLIHLLRKKRAP